MTSTVLNTEIDEVENKIPDTSSLVKQLFLIQKLVKLRIKFQIMLNTLLLPEFNKLTAETFAAILKQARLILIIN